MESSPNDGKEEKIGGKESDGVENERGNPHMKKKGFPQGFIFSPSNIWPSEGYILVAGQKETTTRNDVSLTAIIFLRLAHVNSEFESRVSVRPSFPLSHTLALRFKTQEIHTASRRKTNGTA